MPFDVEVPSVLLPHCEPNYVPPILLHRIDVFPNSVRPNLAQRLDT